MQIFDYYKINLDILNVEKSRQRIILLRINIIRHNASFPVRHVNYKTIVSSRDTSMQIAIINIKDIYLYSKIGFSYLLYIETLNLLAPNRDHPETFIQRPPEHKIRIFRVSLLHISTFRLFFLNSVCKTPSNFDKQTDKVPHTGICRSVIRTQVVIGTVILSVTEALLSKDNLCINTPV